MSDFNGRWDKDDPDGDGTRCNWCLPIAWIVFAAVLVALFVWWKS